MVLRKGDKTALTLSFSFLSPRLSGWWRASTVVESSTLYVCCITREFGGRATSVTAASKPRETPAERTSFVPNVSAKFNHCV